MNSEPTAVHQCGEHPPEDLLTGAAWRQPDGQWDVLPLLGTAAIEADEVDGRPVTTIPTVHAILAHIAYCPRCGDRLPQRDEPAEAGYAAAVRDAAARLQRAVSAAERAGLVIEIRQEEMHHPGEAAPMPVIDVKVFRPL